MKKTFLLYTFKAIINTTLAPFTRIGFPESNFFRLSHLDTCNYSCKCHSFLSERRIDVIAACDIFRRAYNDVIVVIIIIINIKHVRGPGSERYAGLSPEEEEEGFVAAVRVFRKTPLSTRPGKSEGASMLRGYAATRARARARGGCS